MRKLICLYFFVVLFAVVIIPCFIVIGSGRSIKFSNKDHPSDQSRTILENKNDQSRTILENKSNKDHPRKIKVYDHVNKKYFDIDLEKYVENVVAAEMPSEYELEALKAQAVAARSYTFARVCGDIEAKDDEHKKSATCTNYKHCQAYAFEENLIKQLGEKKTKEKFEKIRQAVKATIGQILTYDGKCANPLFHSCSGGMTETPKNVWGGANVPYLKSVKSPGEEKSEQFSSVVSVKKSEFYEKLSAIKEKVLKVASSKTKKKNYYKVLATSESNRVVQLEVNGCVYRGVDVREAFGLKSTMFKMSESGDRIVFNVKGYGHGVGMSQVGANAMAKKGADYVKILSHYYQGTKIEAIS